MWWINAGYWEANCSSPSASRDKTILVPIAGSILSSAQHCPSRWRWLRIDADWVTPLGKMVWEMLISPVQPLITRKCLVELPSIVQAESMWARAAPHHDLGPILLAKVGTDSPKVVPSQVMFLRQGHWKPKRFSPFSCFTSLYCNTRSYNIITFSWFSPVQAWCSRLILAFHKHCGTGFCYFAYISKCENDRIFQICESSNVNIRRSYFNEV